MASLLLKGVHKRLGLPTVSISCSSADATSVISSTGPGSGSSRIIDRHSPRLQDPYRTSTSRPPRPSSSSDKDHASSSSDSTNQQQQHGHGGKKKKKKKKESNTAACGATRSSEKRLVSPATSSRFLLNSSRMQSDDVDIEILVLPPPPPPPTSFIDVHPGEAAPVPTATGPVFFPEKKPSEMQLAESSSSGSSSASSSSEIAPVGGSNRDGYDQEVKKRSFSNQAGQVVVLRVSLHCKGCAGKVKKHIAKMEGVTSFEIDIATKKVTVVGDVTPLGVLNSVSKVKPAQFWPSSPPPFASAASF